MGLYRIKRYADHANMQSGIAWYVQSAQHCIQRISDFVNITGLTRWVLSIKAALSFFRGEVMKTIRELAKSPNILAASKIDDSMFPLLTDLECAVVLASRKIVAEFNTGRSNFK